MDSPRRVTFPPAMLTMTPLNPALRMLPTPVGLPSMVIDLVMVTAPNPPGSRQSISPFTAVFEMAPAKVLQGAVRLHGLTSSPTPDTQVRVACACALENTNMVNAIIAKAVKVKRNLFIGVSFLRLRLWGWHQ